MKKKKWIKPLDVLKREFSGLRTGRASVSLLDPINVEAYGSKTPLIKFQILVFQSQD